VCGAAETAPLSESITVPLSGGGPGRECEAVGAPVLQSLPLLGTLAAELQGAAVGSACAHACVICQGVLGGACSGASVHCSLMKGPMQKTVASIGPPTHKHFRARNSFGGAWVLDPV
jgi:hypothetical protein